MPIHFQTVSQEIASHKTGNRTDSVALLAWFLGTVWRLEPDEIEDAICDGGGDQGIDALAFDVNARDLTIFQSKHRQTADKEQGDTDLKSLVGASAYFESTAAVDGLLHSRINPELKRLLQRLDVRTKVADGLTAIRLVFVTNALLNRDGRNYLTSIGSRVPPVEVWDRTRIAPVAASTQRPALRPEQITLKSTAPATVHPIDATTKMAIALVDAVQLAALPGIDDLSIFARNVRLSLGGTRINRELSETLRDRKEHSLLPAYHNGLTILTSGLDVRGKRRRLNGFTVVNGCQSLVAMYENKQSLSPDAKVLVKIVEVDVKTGLSDKITYRTNNQNPVDLRDQRSTDPIQRQLQVQMKQSYAGRLSYRIRSGEQLTQPILDNSLAAQLIMAVYIQEPWAAVRKVRLFDESYHRVFGRDITAHRLYLLNYMDVLASSLRSELRLDLAASFASVRFTLLYLVSKVLQLTDEGSKLIMQPQLWLPDAENDVGGVITELTRDVIESVNSYVAEREAEVEEEGEAGTFDPKVVFKSRTGIQKVQADVLRDAKRYDKRERTQGRDYLFRLLPLKNS